MICEADVMSCRRQTCVGLPDPGWQTGGYQLGAMMACGQVRGVKQLKRAELLQMGLRRTEEHWTDAACNKTHCKVALAKPRQGVKSSNVLHQGEEL